MKLHSKNTALYFLEDKDPAAFAIIKNDTSLHPVQRQRIREEIKRQIITNRAKYAEHVQYLSDPFLNAYEKIKDRIKLDLEAERLDQWGTFVVRREDGNKNTLFYHVRAMPDADGVMHMSGHLFVFGYDKIAPQPVLYIMHWPSGIPGIPRDYVGDEEQVKKEVPYNLWVELMFTILFMKHCPLETKIVTPGKKQEHIGTKYINDTKSKIEIVDCTWFTTIIRNEGFGVIGHFRLQPYPSLNKKQWIYIQPFEKKGYTRKAKILTNGPALPKSGGMSE